MRHRSEHLLAFSLVLSGALSFLTGCGNVKVTDPSYYARISTTASTIRVNQQIQIVNNEKITGVPLTFYVNGIAGGNAQLGTIDSNGLYTAPAIVPVPNNITITSASSNAAYPPGQAALAVLNPIPILSSVTPTGFSEGVTTVTVTGSDFVYGAQISWNGALITTTYVSGTQLLAAIAAPNPGTFPLLVTNPDPGSANSATMQVKVAPGQVVLKLEPNEGTDVRVTNSIGFGLEITGTANTGVTLTINGVPNGNATVGTVVQNKDGSLTYTAPAVVPSPNVVQLGITSVDNPTVSISHNISVLNPIPILTSSNPTSFNVGSASVVLTGQSFINGATVLMNGQPVSTTFNSGTQLTATVNPTQPGTIDLQVLNPNPGPATSADLIADVAGGAPTLQVSYTDASRFLQQATFGATDGDVHSVALTGFQPWLDQQFAAAPTTMEPGVEAGSHHQQSAVHGRRRQVQCGTVPAKQPKP